MAEPRELEGQVALVTGAGSGIGRAAALCLARAGAAVGLLSRTRRQLEEVARAVEEHGGQALVLEADTSRPAEVHARTFSNSGATAYAASTAGQVALTKMLAVELAKDRIRVNVVCPGAISTEIADNTEQRNAERARAPELPREPSVPLTRGQPGTPEQVADLVLYLASARSSLVSGTEIWIDGAQSLIT